MTTHPLPNRSKSQASAAVWLALCLSAPMAHSQVSCNNDGLAPPKVIFERFINADCEACWGDPATPVPAPGALALDWVVPGSQGDDAALSAAATRDALARLEESGKASPTTRSSQLIKVTGWPGTTLRVAHGPAVSGYLGASIELILPAGTRIDTPLQPWLVMVETLPQGFEGSPVPRNLIRNVLQPTWNMRQELQTSEQTRFIEIRPMNIPQGAKPERLRVVGWLQDTNGHVLMAAESACPPEEKEEPGAEHR
jgi:hypothetical protein